MLTERLLTHGGSSHGFIHIVVDLLAGITVALIAAPEVFQIILENFRASLTQAFSGDFIQCGFGPLFGSPVRMFTELLDRSVGAPIALILPVALSLHLLVQRVNQQVVSPHDERNPRDPQNHEPLEHRTESAPSPTFIVADYSLAQAPRQRNGVHKYLHSAGTDAGQVGRWAAGADNCLTIYWTFCQFSATEPGCKLMLSQSEVRLMNEITAWMQSNWYELGNLLAEFVFLAVGIWFARKVLRTLRASQEQVGTLIKLTVTGAVPERQSTNTAAERSFATGSPHWHTPSDAPPADQPTPIENGPSRLSSAGRGLVAWLNTPMKSGGAAPWRKAIKWLQSPAGS